MNTTTHPAVSFQSICKSYAAAGKKNQAAALEDVSFDIQQGEFFGLLGPNGAGKTTLINILAGLVKTTAGDVQVFGNSVRNQPLVVRRLVGIVPQELVFDPFFTARQALIFQSGYFGLSQNEKWVDEILERLGLSDKANTNMRALSGGMKRRVLVGLALVHKPPLIVLDEPTAGVDVELRQLLWGFIADLNTLGHTVLLTTHYLEEAEALCGRIAMLHKGKIAALEKTSVLLKNASASVLRMKIDGVLPAHIQEKLGDKLRRTGRIYQLLVNHAQDVEENLALFRTAGVVVEDVEVRKADLEDVFIDIMKDRSATNSAVSSTASAAVSAAA